jgi:hypothetical protein
MLDHLLARLLNALSPERKPASGAGILIGHTLDAPRRAVRLPEARRFEHAVIVGKTGAGKTHCLEQLASQHFERGEGFCFIDFHGDATGRLAGLAASHRDSAARLSIIDPTDARRSPGLNPLEIAGGGEAAAFGRSSELASILKQRWGVDTFGARTEELTRNTLYTLAATGYTIIEAALLLTSSAFRAKLASRLQNPEVAAYWTERYEPLSEPMKAAFREPLLNKLSAFVTDPASRHLLGQRSSTLDFARAMREGQWVLINLSKGTLRDHAHTLGNLIFAKLQFDVMARASLPERARRVYSVFCDEVQNLAENDLMTLVSEGRKYGLSLYTANQFWEQLPRELRGALLSAGTHILFRVSAHDAGALAAELSTQARSRHVHTLTNLPRGQAMVRVGWDPPVVVQIPAPTRRDAPPEQVARVRREAEERCSRPRAEVEAEIRRRRELALAGEEPAHPTHDGTTRYDGAINKEGTDTNGQARW